MEGAARVATRAVAAAARRQQRGVAQFRVDRRLQKGKSFLHHAFKTKAQIVREERKRIAEEWNTWDYESLVRFKMLKAHNRMTKKEEVEAKEELDMQLRVYAKNSFRGGMPRPQQLAYFKELQDVPGRFNYELFIGHGDLTSLDLRKVLKYVNLPTMPLPKRFLMQLLKANHVFDDESSGHFLTICKRRIEGAKENHVNERSHHDLFLATQECFTEMKQHQHGHRCTLGPFAYAQMIKCSAAVGNLQQALEYKTEFIESAGAGALNASVYEGILEAALAAGRVDVAWLEWREMQGRYRLAPTVGAATQMLGACAASAAFAEAEAIWTQVTEELLLKPDLAMTNAMIKVCAAAGETVKAFYYFHNMLEYTTHRPDITTCNYLLSASRDLADVDAVMEVLKTQVRECDDTTYFHVLRVAGAAHDLGALERYWDEMQTQRVRPSVGTVHQYLTALLDLPPNPAAYHPAELLGKGIAAYDWAGRSAIFTPKTFLLLMHLSAKAGQYPIAKLLMKKMLLTAIPYNVHHIAGVAAAIAASDCPAPLRELEGAVALVAHCGHAVADVDDATTTTEPVHPTADAAQGAPGMGTFVMGAFFVLQKRRADVMKEEDAEARIARVWAQVEGLARTGDGEWDGLLADCKGELDIKAVSA
eukprot:TRINITY_DN3158_c0_g5_i1.p1 TRINITY_DN3158_c0_g5~~TRINITY_DN3158_c0_g5_i1.p1  ORF type:complete len:647 (+),score=262.09 TRINITY_DN3158_c0_g5_i1:56-1996(+)